MASYIRILFLINLITAILKSINIQNHNFQTLNHYFSIYQHELFNYDVKSWK